MKTVFLLLFILALSILNGATQTRVLTGTVTSSADGLPIPGASVAVKGTSLGTATNAVGVYSLNLPVNSKVLVFSFVGMKAQEVPVPVSDRLDVVLSPDVINMDEVVVTALGISREKKSLTYSATEVKSDDLARPMWSPRFPGRWPGCKFPVQVVWPEDHRVLPSVAFPP
jgi:hypothetical protein